MKGEKDVKISYWAAHLTTTVSVTLVLLLVGVIAIVTLSSEREARRLMERLEVSLVLNDTVSDAYASRIADMIAATPYAIEPHVVSKQQAIEEWKEETGEDLEVLFGVNPLSPEVIFRLNSAYSSPDSLKVISGSLREIDGVNEVALPDAEMVATMRDNITGLAIILGIIALVMVVISFVLINNTVHLSIYARRFTIHTMQLVGATDGFIRRPFVTGNMISGLMAGLLAAGILAVALAAAPATGWNDVAHYISWGLYACIAGGMIIAGPFLCGLAAAMSTSRYLKKDYDELFK